MLYLPHQLNSLSSKLTRTSDSQPRCGGRMDILKIVVDRRGALLSSVGYNHASSISHSNPTATSGNFHAHVHVHLLLKIRILSHHTSRRDRKTAIFGGQGRGGTLEGLRYGFISPHFSNTYPFLFFQASKVVAAIF